jgi:AbrB family looped-hinge helix DNA binding protein
MTTIDALHLSGHEWRIAAETARKTPVPIIADNLGLSDPEVVKCRVNLRVKLGLSTDEELGEWYREASGENLHKGKPRRRERIDVTATITSKGQITLPKEVRNHLRLQSGDKVRFLEDETGIRFGRQVSDRWPKQWPGYIPLPDGMTVDEYMDLIRGR